MKCVTSSLREIVQNGAFIGKSNYTMLTMGSFGRVFLPSENFDLAQYMGDNLYQRISHEITSRVTLPITTQLSEDGYVV